MKRTLMKFAAMLVAISLTLAALTGVAFAASVYATGGDSYIRSTPDLSGKQLGLLPDGATATYLGDSSVDGRGVTWYHITYKSTTGWVSSKYTSTSGSPAPSQSTLYASGGDSYIRSAPSLSASQLGLFPSGASATYLGSSSVDERGVTWYRITYKSKTGWVSSRYTSFSPNPPSPSSHGTLYATGGDSYIRSQPNLSGAQLGLFPSGASATYLGDSSVDSRGVTWYRITYKSKTGWVSSRYTSFTKSPSKPTSYGTVHGSGGDSYIRNQPNLSGKQLGLFPNGASATYLGDRSVDSRGVAWYHISYKGTSGWVSSKYTYLS